jgi:bacillithiol biosynthesis deacetylase BshB1
MNSNKVDILAIGVHPDDVELSCSGTLLKQISFGNSIGICDLTRGELGTRGNAELRADEAKIAAEMMGSKFRVNLMMKDGFFQIDSDHLLKVIEIIRWCQPDIILANALEDRHPDHGRAAILVKEAAFLSGLIKIKTIRDGIEQTVWRPKQVFHYVQDRNTEADFVIDISEFMDKKMELINCFSSQFYNPDSSEPETPISIKNFRDHIRAKNMWYARDIQTDYAEAFRVEKNIGVRNLFEIQ